MLHVLLHMARHDGPLTSEQISKMLDTNPVVVRRTMAGLRDAGYVRSDKGRGGGWKIVGDLDSISLLDVYRAVGAPGLFAIGGGDESAPCAVERLVTAALADALRQAERMLLDRLAHVTLADLLDDFDEICRAAGWNRDGPPPASLPHEQNGETP